MENPGENSQGIEGTHGEGTSISSPERVEAANDDGVLALRHQEQVMSDDESKLDEYDDDYDALNNQTRGKEPQLSKLSEAICGFEERLAERLTEFERVIAQAIFKVQTQTGSERRRQREERDMDIINERPIGPLDPERQLCVKASRSNDNSTMSMSDIVERGQGRSMAASIRNASPVLRARKHPTSEERTLPSIHRTKEIAVGW